MKTALEAIKTTVDFTELLYPKLEGLEKIKENINKQIKEIETKLEAKDVHPRK